jgi:hypothetical protein
MEAVRCLRCGETRWTFRPGQLARLLGEPCESCGGPVVRERRKPGGARGRPRVERRQATAPPTALTGER